MTHEDHGIALPDGEELVVLERVDVARGSSLDPRTEWLRRREYVELGEIAVPRPAEPAR